jgi:hypothetical protein
MTITYKLKYDDVYYIIFEWWHIDNIDIDIRRYMVIYLYDKNDILILEDRNITFTNQNIENYMDLHCIKIHIVLKVTSYFIFSEFVCNFLKNKVKVRYYNNLKNVLAAYDRDIKLKNLIK